MLRFRPEARVGLVIFVGVLALIIIYWFLGGWRLRARTYTVYVIFRNIQRLSEGAEVRMAGVLSERSPGYPCGERVAPGSR